MWHSGTQDLGEQNGYPSDRAHQGVALPVSENRLPSQGVAATKVGQATTSAPCHDAGRRGRAEAGVRGSSERIRQPIGHGQHWAHNGALNASDGSARHAPRWREPGADKVVWKMENHIANAQVLERLSDQSSGATRSIEQAYIP